MMNAAHRDVPATEVRIIPLGTGPVWSDRSGASFLRDRYFPPTAVDRPTIAVLQLSAEPTIGTLQEFLLPLGQRIRGGEYGQLFLVVQSDDEAVAGFVRYLSREYDLPISVWSSPPGGDAAGSPVGDLTGTEQATIDALRSLGGASTPPQLAETIGIEPTAAGNRLVNLAKKGYVYRVNRARRLGDIFVDPWARRAGAEDPVADR